MGKPKSDEGPVKGPITPIFKVLVAEALAAGVAGGDTAATVGPCCANEHTLANEASKKTKLLLADFENGEKIEDIRDFWLLSRRLTAMKIGHLKSLPHQKEHGLQTINPVKPSKI